MVFVLVGFGSNVAGRRCSTFSATLLQERLASLMAKLDGPSAQEQVRARVRACATAVPALSCAELC